MKPAAPETPAQIESTQSIGTRLREAKGAHWLVVLGVLFVAVAVWQGRWLFDPPPDLGFDIRRLPGPPTVGAHEARWGDLASGDVVVSLEGAAVTAETFADLRDRVRLGPVRATFSHEGVEHERVATALEPNRVKQVAAFARWLTAVLVFVLGATMLLLRPAHSASRVFCFFMISLAFLLIFGRGMEHHWRLLWIVSYGSLTFAELGAFHLFASFPYELRLRRWVKPMYAVGAMLVVFDVIDNLSQSAWSVTSLLLFEAAQRALTVVLVLPSLMALRGQYVSAVQLENERLRKVAKLLLVATGLGLIVPLLTGIVVHALALDGSALHHFTTVGVIVFASIVAISLLMYNPFDVDRYSIAVAQYVVVSGTLFGTVSLILVAVPLAMSRLEVATSVEAIIASTIATVLVALFVHRRALKWVERWFARAPVDVLEASEAYRRVNESMRVDPRATTLQTIVEQLLIAGAERAALWEVDPRGQAQPTFTSGEATPAQVVDARGPLAAVLIRTGGLTALTPCPFDPDTQQALRSVGLVLSAPIKAFGVPIGFLGLGRKRSGGAYGRADLAFLETMAAQVGFVRERNEPAHVGPYRIDRRLGGGGMAEVFLARQVGPGGFERQVALKRLLPELAEDPSMAAGIFDEARITASLQHPNIVRVYDVAIYQGQPHIAMELIDGLTLRALIGQLATEATRPPKSIGLAVAQGLLDALEHAHRHHDSNGRRLNVIHRDVTPSNVMLSIHGETKLVDFGLAFAAARLFQTEPGRARGTRMYMSPEQLQGDPVDARTDVYGAAATLFEFFTGRRARPDGPVDTPLVSESEPSPEAALDAVWSRAMAFKREDRFPSARAFREALEVALAGLVPASAGEIARWLGQRRANLPLATGLPNRTESLGVG